MYIYIYRERERCIRGEGLEVADGVLELPVHVGEDVGTDLAVIVMCMCYMHCNLRLYGQFSHSTTMFTNVWLLSTCVI